MVTKTDTGGSFKGTLQYCLGVEKSAEIVLSEGVRTDSMAHMVTDFVAQKEMSSRVNKAVFHASFSFSKEDMSKLNGEGEKEILSKYLETLKEKKGIDFTNTQYMFIRHNDKEHPHYHLVANLVNNDGKRINLDQVGYKMKDISKEITKEFKLTPAVKKEYQQAVKEHGYNIKEGIKSVKEQENGREQAQKLQQKESHHQRDRGLSF